MGKEKKPVELVTKGMALGMSIAPMCLWWLHTIGGTKITKFSVWTVVALMLGITLVVGWREKKRGKLKKYYLFF